MPWRLLLSGFLGLVLVACVKRTPCDQTRGADVCSMTPERYTCTCDGVVEAAQPSDQPVACGQVATMCVGRVTESRPAGPLSPLGTPNKHGPLNAPVSLAR